MTLFQLTIKAKERAQKTLTPYYVVADEDGYMAVMKKGKLPHDCVIVREIQPKYTKWVEEPTDYNTVK